jgi:ATP-binding cassette subfamily B protein
MSDTADFCIYKQIVRRARPYWLHLIGVLALSMLSTPLGLLGPLPLKIVVDSAIGSHPLPSFLGMLTRDAVKTFSGTVLFAVVLLIGITLLSQFQELLTNWLATCTGERLVLDFRTRLFHHVQRLSLSYHDIKGTADSIYRIQSDAMALQYLTIDGLIPFVSACFSLLGMIWVAASIDWQLALIAMAISPFLFLLSKSYRPLFRVQSREVRKLESSALSIIQEVLSSLRVVKAFGREDHEAERYVSHSQKGMRARIHLALFESGYGVMVGLITTTGTAAVLWVGARHVRAGTLTLGSLLLVMAYIGQLYDPLKTIGRKAGSLQGHLVGVQRALHLLELAPDVVDRPDARRLDKTHGNIEYRDVSFGYRSQRPILRNVSFEVPSGAHVGIIGRTGSGKTTLMNLLSRFYDPDEGQILLDGVDLRDYKLEDLRNQFAIVLQEPVLFSTTIEENIGYARPGASNEEIIQAAKLANAHDFIVALPDGYHTMVGERGMQLSGGERQRISLARAFLKDAPILILDEPTSSVDVKTEAKIVEAMARLMRNRTTFMIAHRVSTLDGCQILLDVSAGHVEVIKLASAVQNQQRHAVSIRSESHG